MSSFFQRAWWSHLAGACVVAIVAATPILMSRVMDRGFEIAKQSLAEPLAVLACGAVLLAGGWNWLAQQAVAIRIAAISLAVFLVLAGMSTALSDNSAVAIFGGYFRREGLLAWVAYGAFFYAVLGWAHNRERVLSLLDVMLAASVIPAAYALQQRAGLDFYPLAVGDFMRPSSTIGNPLFLGAYFALLLPLTAVRCWQARRAMPQLAMWVMVAVLQACGLLVTQSRGPLLAAILGLLMIAFCVAGHARKRSFFVLAFLIFGFTAASVVAINTLPAARHWAQDVPVASRLVFSLERDAGAATQLASRSAAARLAIWGAGSATFAAAPFESKLLGYGPESAYLHYFSHMPASVMRLVGYGAYETYDRLHADALDIGLNFGLLGWLVYALFFTSVMYAAARALWGLSGGLSTWILVALTSGGGVIAAALAAGVGLASAAVPAFGVGVGAGWFLFMVGCAWRALTHEVPATTAMPAGHWALLAGLASALLVFWFDAQVNIPVLTTRLISFGIAALILLVAEGGATRAEKAGDADAACTDLLRIWGYAICIVVTCASWLPIAVFDAGTGGHGARWWLAALPLLPLLLFAAVTMWGHARSSGGFNGGVVRVSLAVAVGLPLVYAAIHFALSVRADTVPGLDHAQAIAMASFAGPVFIFAMCIAYALLMSRGATPAATVQRPTAWLSIGAVAAAMLLVAAMDWRVVRADVAATLAVRVAAKEPQLGVQLIEEAIRLLPHERHYRRQLVFDLLGRAVADLRALDEAPGQTNDAPGRLAGVLRNLAAAETAARTAVRLFPSDPWVVAALANVLQIEALRVLRPLDPAGGLDAAREADQLFAQTHRMFPSEPLLLRNWAQLLADQGNLAAAYRLLDAMEKLIPNDPEPYVARLGISNQANDYKDISSTLARARERLEPEVFKHLPDVAKTQQK